MLEIDWIIGVIGSNLLGYRIWCKVRGRYFPPLRRERLSIFIVRDCLRVGRVVEPAMKYYEERRFKKQAL